MYDMPAEIDVAADGPLRIVTLNRPDALNAVNDALHTGLARLWPRISEDCDARAVVLTGAGRAFCAGGDFSYLRELSGDPGLRARTIAHGRDLVLGMARCRVPVVAAVNGPAVGLGCSLVALSDVVYIAPGAYLADPHVQIGLVAADGGPLTWPLHTSLLFAKEYALTGARIPAARAVEMGLANHVADDPVSDAISCAKRIAGLPRQAVESTKRVLNLQLERAVLASLDFAMTAEEQSFSTPDFRAIVARLTEGKTAPLAPLASLLLRVLRPGMLRVWPLAPLLPGLWPPTPEPRHTASHCRLGSPPPRAVGKADCLTGPRQASEGEAKGGIYAEGAN